MDVAAHTDGLELRLPATLGAVGRGRRAVVSYAMEAGFDETVVGRIGIAVGEALANVVVHAYRLDPEPDAGEMLVHVAEQGDGLQVIVGDHGCGPAPRDDSPGAGVGLLLIDSQSDGHEIRAGSQGGTTVRMEFVQRPLL